MVKVPPFQSKGGIKGPFILELARETEDLPLRLRRGDGFLDSFKGILVV